MTIIKIGSARHDEKGTYVNGEVGDNLQAGTNDMVGEVSMQNMYVHSKGWYIIRPKSVEHANAIANLMEKACNNQNIGYDQNNRLGIITYGIGTTTKTECDCSSLVRQVVKEATGTDTGNFTTSNEANKLIATGLFENKIAYVSQISTPVYNGDVLVTKTKGHTAVVVSGNPRVSKESTASTGGSVKFNVGDTVNFTGCLHYNSSFSSAIARGCKAGLAKITAISAGKPYPYHLKAIVGKGSTVYGWVKEADIAGVITGKRHTVGAGETLSKIAKKYGTTVEALVRLNGIKDKNIIRIGQVIYIP